MEKGFLFDFIQKLKFTSKILLHNFSGYTVHSSFDTVPQASIINILYFHAYTYKTDQQCKFCQCIFACVYRIYLMFYSHTQWDGNAFKNAGFLMSCFMPSVLCTVQLRRFNRLTITRPSYPLHTSELFELYDYYLHQTFSITTAISSQSGFDNFLK